MKKFYRYLFVFLFTAGLVAIDIVTKVLFEGASISLIPNFFILESTHNYGAGLGILSGQTVLLIVISIIFLLAFIIFDIFYKKQSKLYFISFNLILAGGIGNLIDRIFLGYVRDFIFINVPFMPYYFNLADAFLTIGVVLLIIDILFKKEPNKESVSKTKDGEESKDNGKENNN